MICPVRWSPAIGTDGLNPDIAIALDHAGIGFLRDAAWSRAIARYGGDGRRGNDMRHGDVAFVHTSCYSLTKSL